MHQVLTPDYVTSILKVLEHQPHLAYYIANDLPNNTLAYNSTASDDLSESRGGSDTLPPDILPLDRHLQHRQNATHIIHVRYDSLKLHYHWWSQGAV